MRNYIAIIVVVVLLINCSPRQKQKIYIKELDTEVWPEQQIKKWYKEQPFLVGGNYVPISSINQLEMW